MGAWTWQKTQLLWLVCTTFKILAFENRWELTKHQIAKQCVNDLFLDVSVYHRQSQAESGWDRQSCEWSRLEDQTIMDEMEIQGDLIRWKFTAPPGGLISLEWSWERKGWQKTAESFVSAPISGIHRSRNGPTADDAAKPASYPQLPRPSRNAFSCRVESGAPRNKFVYTKAQSRVIGQEQLCPKIMKKVKWFRTDRQTDRQTDRVNYRVALTRLKRPL